MSETKKNDLINFTAILFSLIVAIYIPFELFLLSYAILGPLHYLTEINWLKSKNYFVEIDKKWFNILILTSILISVIPLVSALLPTILFDQKEFFAKYFNFTNYVILFSIILSSLFAFLKLSKHLLLVIPFVLVIIIIMGKVMPEIALFIIVLVPTILHVYVFTLIFVFVGFLKTKSIFALINTLLLICALVLIIYLPIQLSTIQISNWALTNFLSSGLSNLNLYLFKFFNLNPGTTYTPFSVIGYKLQIFVAFAYTYHYLNWFIKTTVIGWKKSLTQNSTYIILSLWFISISVYYIDYKLGFSILFTLSFIHVLFELPLNVKTVQMIFSSSKSK